MCGINGIYSGRPEINKKIVRLNNLLKHRGPDDEGYVCINTSAGTFSVFSGDDSIDSIKKTYPGLESSNIDAYDLILGHRRLSIIDLSEGGHGPMSDEHGVIWITYNGEIYNYIELRDELISYGYTFRTQSDTEVLIKSYLRWGTDCFNRFNGMWAFALWDSRSKKLILSRDRFGIKPLYYTNTDSYFAFSSEIKPLLYLNKPLNGLNEKLIPFFILYGNRLNSEETYITGINSLPPSHYLEYSEGKTEIKRYYEIPVAGQNNKTEEQLKEELVHLFSDSIRLRFRSDAAVGTCLSGGFDSSSIAAFSNKIFGKGLNTFSAVWSYKECDESKYIDIVNKEYQCVPNKIEPPADEFETSFDSLCRSQEIPTEGPGLYPQWYVMQKAHGKVKVLLDGQGGDEVFGGYFLIGAYLRSLIRDKKISDMYSNIPEYLSFFRKRGIHGFTSWMFPRFYNKLVRNFPAQRFKILNKDILRNVSRKNLYHDIVPPELHRNYLNNLSYHFITQLSIPTLLHYEDRSSMAHSIESRVPFLDYRIVEFGVNLPAQYLSDKDVSRPLFRKAFGSYLPLQILNRKDKLGYPVPFDKWTRKNIKEYVVDILTNRNALMYKYLNYYCIEENINSHFKEKTDYSWDIWRLLSFEKFLELIK